MGDRDWKGINMIPEISMHMSKGVIKKKNEEKKKLRLLNSIKVQMQLTALKSVAGGAAADSNRQKQEES